jgi:hypothetical protein
VSGRRLLLLLIVLGAVGAPAAVLSLACAGSACPGGIERATQVPFCPLPDRLKSRISNGYREGRSPDVLGVASGTPLFTEADGGRTAWPGPRARSGERVPVVFWGTGVSGKPIREPIRLDSIAPTVAEILGFERPFPEVRSGSPAPEVPNGDPPSLVLLVAWKGVGSTELENGGGEWGFLSSMLADGSGTMEATTGSLPLDPAATLTTIGTGGLPSQHGITGSFIRNDEGRVVEAFGREAPPTVIATLADDLDEHDRASKIGLVAADELDRGIVGKDWYPGADPVDVVIGRSATAPLEVEAHLRSGYGRDDVPDLLGVVLQGDLASLDRWTERIVAAAEQATDDSTLVVVAGTGSRETDRTAIPESVLVDLVEDAIPGEARAVESAVAGGLFLDQDVLRRERVTGLVAVDAMSSATTTGGSPILMDVFQGFAVSFARYC